MTAHDLADLFDIRRAIAGQYVGDIVEVVRAQQTRTDDCEKTGVYVPAVIEFVNHPTRYEKRLSRIQVGAFSTDGKRGDAVQPEDGFIEAVVAVGRGHARVSGDIALEDADTAPGLISVDVKADAHSPDLDRVSSGVSHECDSY
jgi:hypothetical protein